MKSYKLIAVIAALAAASNLSSCIVQQTVELFIRDTYPGQRPPMVIADVDGKPASNNWLSVDENDLPPSSAIEGRIRKADDGIPYGLTDSFEDIVISPYSPNKQLDYKGFKAGAKVWDPYTRKPFYIPRSYTFN